MADIIAGDSGRMKGSAVVNGDDFRCGHCFFTRKQARQFRSGPLEFGRTPLSQF